MLLTEKKNNCCREADYYALPDDVRAELLDGILCDMVSPSQIYQELSGELSRIIGDHIISKVGSCKVITAPFEVKLEEKG